MEYQKKLGQKRDAHCKENKRNKHFNMKETKEDITMTQDILQVNRD